LLYPALLATGHNNTPVNIIGLMICQLLRSKIENDWMMSECMNCTTEDVN